MNIAVVGAGPAGASFAWRAAQDGAQVTIFDASHPREKPCGGGVTGKALGLLPPALDDDPLPARWVTRCAFDSGAGESTEVTLERPVAVAPRRELDAWLLRRAVAAGARHISERVVEVDAAGRVRTSASGERYFDVVVGADGTGSLVRRMLLSPTPRERLTLAVGWYATGTSDMVVQFLPGLDGYLWLFPRPDHVGVGICAPLGRVPTQAILQRLEREVGRAFPALARGEEKVYSAMIASPSADPRSILEIGGDRWALLGDAGALADPITGEGIYYALRSAEVLAETLRADASPARYPERALAAFGHELLKAAALRERFYAPGFAQRMVRYSVWSPAVRRVLADLVLGEQGYFGLKRRLLRAGPRFLLDAALARVGA